MNSEVAVDISFRFLSLPAEIRLNIYRYLLLETRLATLNPYYYPHDWTSGEETASIPIQDDDDDHHHINSSLEGGPWMDNHLNPNQLPAPWMKNSIGQLIGAMKHKQLFKDQRIERHTAILRTNHQIYQEASALLYSSLVMEVLPGDVVFSDTWDGVVGPSENIWRSFPRRPGVKNHPVEKVGYKRSNHLHGTMQPASFAKFERLAFMAHLDLTARGKDLIQAWPKLFVDDQFHTSRDDERVLKAYLNGEGTRRPPVTDIFRQFVDVLVKSPYISHLDISFGVFVEVGFGIDSEDSEDEGDEDGRKRREKKKESMVDVANECAGELALEVGLLDPLKRLSNVRRLALSFIYPKPKILRMARELERVVEGNFVAKQGVA